VLLATVAVILGVVAGMASFDRYSVIWKAVVIPILLIGALVSHRLRRFVDDWAVFLALVILFDFVRGFVFALVTHYQLPVYMMYAIDWERALLGGDTFPVLVQTWRASLANPALLDRALTLVHGSHFAFFLVFGMAVWLLRPEAFRSYKTAIVSVLFAGALGYLVVPTIPPWMAADSFGVLPPVDSVVTRIYNAELPTLQRAFDINPIAAMPSLHAALPTLCALIAVRLFGWWGLGVVLYTMVVYFASGYLGQHYLVDLLAGAALAVGAFFAVSFLGDGSQRRSPAGRAARPILVSALWIVVAQGVGVATTTLQQPLVVTRSFATRELLGNTPQAHLFLGSDSFRVGDWPEARRSFERAILELQDPANLLHAQVWLARTAFRQGDHERVVEVLEPIRAQLDPASAMLLGASYLEVGRRRDGAELLQQLATRFPNEPEPVFWLTRHRFLQQELSAGELRQVAENLSLRGERADHFRRALLELLPAQIP
jgi:tetratricopeptide (TPR) repeat protein